MSPKLPETDTAARVAGAASQVGAGWAVLSGEDSVCYATGVPVEIEAGLSPFAGGPALAVVDPDGHATLLVPDNAAAGPGAADLVVTYPAYSGTSIVDPLPLYLEALAGILAECRGTVAVEARTLPASVARLLARLGLETADFSRELARARAVKVPRELAALRRSARVAAAGQRAARRAVAPGATELEVFAQARAAMEAAAGERVAVAGDLVSGLDRTAAIGGWPGNRVLREGDPVIADLAPRVAGYWADSCSTTVCGQASPELRRLHAVVRSALEKVADLVLPGYSAQQVDGLLRAEVGRGGASYPHHSGHGIGASVHEYPRLVGDEPAILVPGMVILLEPGAYLPGVGGVRLEWMFEVTDTGLACLTDFPLDLELA